MNTTLRHRSLLALLCAFAFVLVACEKAPEPQPLRDLEIPLSGISKLGTIPLVDDNGFRFEEEYRYFKYDTVEEALEDKKKISKDGKKVDGKLIGWDGPVHFYHRSKSIAIYVGGKKTVLEEIAKALGPQFAGDE